ncbi:UDP-Glycosyltransferase/glycogen phosphorylase [Gigaspora margarita]|uniref:UDP-Glycosyltransferase/glycogen phosphorylase n=1 Tax=Gigaspora margarita TaxID=4874 RepID=A0A8H3XG74_GIGMA|nr:UDP-Glycosyltransferase/glycogen phosphorylase [Gigaspora margarita]
MYSKLWYLAIFIILFINTNLATETHGAKKTEFIQRELDIDKSDTPKNILVGSILGGNIISSWNFTATSTLYRSIPQIIIDNFVYPEAKKLFFNENDIKSWANGMRRINHKYTEHFNNYLQAFKEIKPDLFFCDYIGNNACFDLASKLKKPVVGFISGTIYFTPPPPIRSDPIMGRGCHVSMENESFYNRFICAVVQPLRAIWTFQDSLNNINAKRAEVGVCKYHDFRGRTDTLFLLDNFFGFEYLIKLSLT